MSAAATHHPIVSQLEAGLLPGLHALVLELSAAAPSVQASVFAVPVGSSTPYQGFHIGISCLLPGVSEPEPDEVALVVSACHLDRQARLNAEVVWCHPSGHVEASLSRGAASSEHWPFATPERIAAVLAELPRLLRVFTHAVQRGHP